MPARWPSRTPRRIVTITASDGTLTGQASFETESPDWEGWDTRHHPEPRLIARDGDLIVGWAAVAPTSARPVYRGVAEVSVYVDPEHSGRGIGTALMAELIPLTEQAGIWTLQSSVFPENEATVALHRRYGFREVGRRERIARHHGVWRDTIVFERRSPDPD